MTEQSKPQATAPFGGAANFRQAEQRMLEMLLGMPTMPLIGIDQVDKFESLIQGAIQAAPEGTTPAIEVLLRSEDAVDAGLAKLAELKEQYGDQVNIIAGSAIKPEDVEKVAAAGLDGLIGGGFCADVAQAALEKGLPYLPGFMTLAEVKAAHEMGLKLVKLFPAIGPDLKAVMAPLARTGIKAYTPEDTGVEDMLVCTTPTEVLEAYQAGVKEVVVDPADSDAEREQIIRFLTENKMVACCTGGINAGNLSTVAKQRPVIGAGLSFIMAESLRRGGDLAEATKAVISEANTIWTTHNVMPLQQGAAFTVEIWRSISKKHEAAQGSPSDITQG